MQHLKEKKSNYFLFQPRFKSIVYFKKGGGVKILIKC